MMMRTLLAPLLIVFLAGCPSDEPREEWPTEEEVLLNVGLYNETDQTDASETAVRVTGQPVWQPGLRRYPKDTTLGRHPVGETRQLTIYPEGLSGDSVRVPFSMKKGMRSGVASSKHYIEVYDDSVIVMGPAIEDDRRAYRR